MFFLDEIIIVTGESCKIIDFSYRVSFYEHNVVNL